MPLPIFDLSTNPRNTLSPFYRNPTAFCNLIPIGNGFYGNPGTTQIGANGAENGGAFLTNQNTNETHLYDGALFVQDRLTVAKQWSAILGVRVDYLGGTASAALANKAGNVQAQGTRSSDTRFVWDPTFTASLNYKPKDWVTFYGTFNQTYSLDEAALYETGGIALSPTGDGKIPQKALKNRSILYEGGVKFDFLNHTLYAAVDGFDQTRSSADSFGDINDIVVRGSEVESTYQPNKHFNVLANFTWSEANYNRRPRYEIQVNFNNITDQRNFSENDGILENNDLVILNEPFNVSATFRYKF